MGRENMLGCFSSGRWKMIIFRSHRQLKPSRIVISTVACLDSMDSSDWDGKVSTNVSVAGFDGQNLSRGKNQPPPGDWCIPTSNPLGSMMMSRLRGR